MLLFENARVVSRSADLISNKTLLKDVGRLRWESSVGVVRKKSSGQGRRVVAGARLPLVIRPFPSISTAPHNAALALCNAAPVPGGAGPCIHVPVR